MRTPPHLFEFLTRDELILALCVVMATKADESYGCYPINRYPTPGKEGGTSDWTELVLRAVRYLNFEHGMLYQGVVPHRDGRLTAERPIAPGNALFVLKFKMGSMPDFDILIPQALTFAGIRCPSLQLEPMRSLLADIEAEIASIAASLTPEDVAVLTNQRQQAVAAARDFMLNPPPGERVH
jgi:hypothetical protein